MSGHVELFLGVAVIGAAIYAILKRVDVRLALLICALALGVLGGDVSVVVRQFFLTLTNEQFVVPICCAMGFAYVMRQSGCDQHLVQLLVKPLRRFRILLIPGAVLVGFLVNIPVVSQTSTVVAIGSVLVPLLRAARISPLTTGSALLLGCSIGGELLNPGAPEFRTISQALSTPETIVPSTECVAHVFPLILPQLAIATGLFWILSLKAEASFLGNRESGIGDRVVSIGPSSIPDSRPPSPDPKSPNPDSRSPTLDPRSSPLEFRVNIIKALVPLVPITLLFLTGPPLQIVSIPKAWLVNIEKPDDLLHFDSRLIGAAMLVGVVLAALVGGASAWNSASAFFEGAGYAFTNIISVIVAATCFGKGVDTIGLAKQFSAFISNRSALLVTSAGVIPLAFAWTCGSGMASTQSLFQFFVDPSQALNVSPLHIGAIVSIASAAGRTMSPVAAVTLMCATLTETNPFDLVRRLALPLIMATAVTILIALVMAII
jgi:DcuC family C4-dicarboxylate transporter